VGRRLTWEGRAASDKEAGSLSDDEALVTLRPDDIATAPKKVFFHTFGCQMNEYDTGKMRAQLKLDGYEVTPEAGDADLILVNTCSIRDKAEQKMHSALGEYRAMKRDRPVVIGIAGCVAQQEGDTLLKRYSDIDLVFGPDAIPHVRQLVREATAGRRVLDTEFLDLETYPFVSDLDPAAEGRIGAFVTIQKGCDNKCTFCIVPTTRGVEVSRPHDEILDEVRGLVATGVKEITLIGQNVNSYGLKRPGGIPFAELLYRVHDVPGVEIIRYTTSHPRDVTPDLVQAYADLPKLASQLHLPVQSGSDRVLKRMKRLYTVDRYREVVAALKAARPDLVLSTDVIVGFPGETDEDFEGTMALLDEVGFVASFSFKYSPRPGTPALKLEDRDPIPDDVASARLDRYQRRQRQLSLQWHRSLEGTVQRVLVEGWSRHDPGVICGRTSTFAMINFPGDLSPVGSWVDVKVTRGFTNSARGERVAVG
jgi:tRNA-2-methylthio-N6-dimethylallyladenosine synthase